MQPVSEFTVVADVPLVLVRDFVDASTVRQIRQAMDRGSVEAAEVVAETIARRDAIRATRSVDRKSVV